MKLSKRDNELYLNREKLELNAENFNQYHVERKDLKMLEFSTRKDSYWAKIDDGSLRTLSDIIQTARNIQIVDLDFRK